MKPLNLGRIAPGRLRSSQPSMTEEARALLAQALEASLRARLRQQTDPSAWLRRVDASVLPDLVATVRAGEWPDGRTILDPANAGLVADVLAMVIARLRAELGDD